MRRREKDAKNNNGDDGKEGDAKRKEQSLKEIQCHRPEKKKGWRGGLKGLWGGGGTPLGLKYLHPQCKKKN